MFLGRLCPFFVDSCRESSESNVIFFSIKVQPNNFGNFDLPPIQRVPDCEDLPIFLRVRAYLWDKISRSPEALELS